MGGRSETKRGTTPFPCQRGVDLPVKEGGGGGMYAPARQCGARTCHFVLRDTVRLLGSSAAATRTGPSPPLAANNKSSNKNHRHPPNGARWRRATPARSMAARISV